MYLYVIANPKNFLYAGICEDPVKTVAMYESLPFIHERQTRLVYLEQYTSSEEAMKRLYEFTKLKKEEKITVIKLVNPDLIEFKIGVNIDL